MSYFERQPLPPSATAGLTCRPELVTPGLKRRLLLLRTGVLLDANECLLSSGTMKNRIHVWLLVWVQRGSSDVRIKDYSLSASVIEQRQRQTEVILTLWVYKKCIERTVGAGRSRIDAEGGEVMTSASSELDQKPGSATSAYQRPPGISTNQKTV